MKTVLRKHQIKVFQDALPILQEKGVVLVACEMRVGKTLVALELARSVGGDILFITKKQAISSILSDSKDLGVDCTVINYESLHKLKKGVKWGVVVLDESHSKISAYPKLGKTAGLVRQLVGEAKCILLTGTPCIESGSQLFHQFHVTSKGPWFKYKDFYGWHRDKGVPQSVRISGGQRVADYSGVKPVVLEDVGPYCVAMTQEEAGFKHKAEVVAHQIENEDIVSWGAKFKRAQVAEVVGRMVVAENPAAVLQKMHMAEGGTLIDDNDLPFVHGIGGLSKIDYMIGRLKKDLSYFVTTAYIAERDLILEALRCEGFNVTDDYEEFKEGKALIFVGSGISYAEGVDLSWLTGAMIIYSLNWSGSKFAQLLERQNNFLRDKPIKIHCLLTKNGIDEYVFKAVSEKKNFNGSFYRGTSR